MTQTMTVARLRPIVKSWGGVKKFSRLLDEMDNFMSLGGPETRKVRFAPFRGDAYSCTSHRGTLRIDHLRRVLARMK